LILAPPLPINEPHWLAGTMSRSVMSCFVAGVQFGLVLCKSYGSHNPIIITEQWSPERHDRNTSHDSRKKIVAVSSKLH